MKKSLAIFFILFFSFIFVQIAESQSIGDFRTRPDATGIWSGNNVWQICTSLSPETWTNTTSNPGSTLSYNVTIRSNSTITWSSYDITLNSGKVLEIESGSTFNIASTAGTFTSSGTTNIYGTLQYRKTTSDAYPNRTGANTYVNERTSYGTSGTCELYVEPDNTNNYHNFMYGNESTAGETFNNISYIVDNPDLFFCPAKARCIINGIFTVNITNPNSNGQSFVVFASSYIPHPEYKGILIENGNAVVRHSAADAVRELTVTEEININNGKLIISDNETHTANIYLKGNLNIAGGEFTNKTPGADGNLILNGTNTQTINQTVGRLFTNIDVTVDNSSGITLQSDFTVPGTLTITNGLFKTGANTLTLDGGFVINSPDATKMIVLDDGTNLGTLKRKVTSNIAYLFYAGDSRGTTEFSPVTLTFTGTTFSDAYVKLKLKNEKHVNNSSNIDFIDRYWEITTEGTLNSLNYYIKLQYAVLDRHGTEANMILGKLNGSTWEPFGSPNTTLHYFEKSGLTSFSTFTGGEEGALPISLSAFNYSVIGKDIKLSWSTSEEINNSGFDVERKSVSSDWQKVGFVQGNNKPSQYEFTERNLTTGKYQYRLKQIDYNGNFEYHNLDGYVEVGIPAKFDLSQNYPNPFNPVTNISYQVASSGVVKITVYDMLGKEVKTLVNEFKEPGYYNMNFDAGNLNSGVYFYRMNAGEYSSVKKLVLMK